MQRPEQLNRLARTFAAALDFLDNQFREPDRWEEECLTYALGAMACGLYPAAEVQTARTTASAGLISSAAALRATLEPSDPS